MGWRRKQYEITSDKRPKRRVFCIDCWKHKLLFDGKKDALNYIRFNGDNIEKERGYRPIRAYKCICCCGWHVTSHYKRNGVKSMVERYLKINDDDMKTMSFYYDDYN